MIPEHVSGKKECARLRGRAGGRKGVGEYESSTVTTHDGRRRQRQNKGQIAGGRALSHASACRRLHRSQQLPGRRMGSNQSSISMVPVGTGRLGVRSRLALRRLLHERQRCTGSDQGKKGWQDSLAHRPLYTLAFVRYCMPLPLGSAPCDNRASTPRSRALLERRIPHVVYTR